MDAQNNNNLLDKKRFSQNEIDCLYSVEKKLEEPIVWKSNDSNTKYTTSADISVNGVVMGVLKCRYNVGNEISFRLQTKNHQLIRMFHHQRGKHENPDGIVYKDIDHKHKGQEEFIYPVDNIDTLNINDALIDFLKECNITFNPLLDIVPLTTQFRFLTTLNQFGGGKN